MRILFVSECYPKAEAPQYGVFIMQQADALSALGNVVDVLVPTLTGKNGKIAYEDNAYRVTYKNTRYDVFPVIVAHDVYNQIYSLLKKNVYDLVAVHITGDGILKMLVKACNRLGIAVVAHYHGLNVWEEYTTVHPYRQKLYAYRRKQILMKTQGIVGVSEKVSNIVSSRIKNVPVETVYNGVNLELFSSDSTNVRNEGAFHVITVGNLIYIKGFSYLLDAFAKLLEQIPYAKLDIIGEGPDREILETQAKKLNIQNSVCFHGKLLYEQVAQMMKKSDLFVLPSFYEALGCVYLEAMGCGLTTIGVCGMGIDEIIKHGENGLLVNRCESNDLYNKMLYVANNPDDTIKLNEKGRETAKKFTWIESAKKLKSFYEKCNKI